MGKLPWTPPQERIRQANMTRFIDFVNRKYSLRLQPYWSLYNWSIENLPDFWAAMLEFTDVVSSHPYEKVVDDLSKFPGTKWFPGAR
jgi:acetoacetyl-CoA synthetase